MSYVKLIHLRQMINELLLFVRYAYLITENVNIGVNKAGFCKNNIDKSISK